MYLRVQGARPREGANLAVRENALCPRGQGRELQKRVDVTRVTSGSPRRAEVIVDQTAQDFSASNGAVRLGLRMR